MKLPHAEPLIFAKNVIKSNETNGTVKCEFQIVPTLAMMIEASAQACAVFFQKEDAKEGYLANVVSIELLDNLESLEYQTTVEKTITFEKLHRFSFFVETMVNKKVVEGELTIYVN